MMRSPIRYRYEGWAEFNSQLDDVSFVQTWPVEVKSILAKFLLYGTLCENALETDSRIYMKAILYLK